MVWKDFLFALRYVVLLNRRPGKFWIQNLTDLSPFQLIFVSQVHLFSGSCSDLLSAIVSFLVSSFLIRWDVDDATQGGSEARCRVILEMFVSRIFFYPFVLFLNQDVHIAVAVRIKR